jgi:thiol-disulfide isomerase/thioredoxin
MQRRLLLKVWSARVSASLLVCVFALFLSGCGNGSSGNESTPVISGPPNTAFPMPPMNPASSAELGWVLLEDKNEREVRRAKIANYHGSVLVLDLYATWCAPCRESIPKLIDLHQRYKSKGLEVVGLNVGGADDRVKVADFAKEFAIPYSLGFPDQDLSDLLLSDNETIPQTFVFDPEGKLVKRFIGYDSSTAEQLEQIVESETDRAAESRKVK